MAFDSILAREIGRPIEPGHDVRRFRDEEVLDALEELISGAKKSIHVTLPVWKPGKSSDRFVAALKAVRQSGVRVRMLVDERASNPGFDEDVRPALEAAGCEVRTVEAFRASVVADGQRALTGHFRIQPERVRETSLRTEGPVVRYIQKAFLDDWKKAGGELPPPWMISPGPSRAETSRRSG